MRRGFLLLIGLAALACDDAGQGAGDGGVGACASGAGWRRAAGLRGWC